jgi:hypothetical protein
LIIGTAERLAGTKTFDRCMGMFGTLAAGRIAWLALGLMTGRFGLAAVADSALRASARSRVSFVFIGMTWFVFVGCGKLRVIPCLAVRQTTLHDS